MRQIERNITLSVLKKEVPSRLTDIKKEKVLLAIFAAYKEEIIKKGYVSLSKRLGAIYLHRYKSRKRILNYKLFKETGKKAYLSNLHTDEYIYCLRWARPIIKNKKYYDFVGCRKLTRAISEFLKEEEPVLVNPKNLI
jgi:hypothetical protein